MFEDESFCSIEPIYILKVSKECRWAARMKSPWASVFYVDLRPRPKKITFKDGYIQGAQNEIQ